MFFCWPTILLVYDKGILFQSLIQLNFLEIPSLYSQGDQSHVVDLLFEVGQTSVSLENFVDWRNDKLEVFAEMSNIHIAFYLSRSYF